MPVQLVVNGVGFNYPVSGDQNWAEGASNWAVAVTQNLTVINAALSPILSNNFTLADGSAAMPSLRYLNSPTTGLYKFAADTIGFSTLGVTVGNIDSTGKWTIGPVGGNVTNSILGSLSISQNLAVTGTLTATLNLASVTGLLAVAHGGTNSAAALSNNRFIVSSAGSIVEAGAVTPSVAVITDSNGLPAASTTTAAELNFVHGVTSPIQAQLNALPTSTVASKSSSYAILDNDGFGTILVTTSTSNLTVTLPSPATNTNRILRIKKVDSGSGFVTVSPHASETIDGYANRVLTSQYNWLTVQCDGTNWDILDQRIVEYVSSSDPTTSGTGSSSSNFTTGTAGHLFNNFAGNTTLFVQFQNPVTSFDTVNVEISFGLAGTGRWNPINLSGSLVSNLISNSNNTVFFGVGTISTSDISTSIISVIFGGGGTNAGGRAWGGATSWSWRVTKVSQ